MGFTNDIEQCLSVLQNGGLILYPTDTIWGIGCDATNPMAVEKVYQLKNRPGNKSLIALLANEQDILTYVTQPDLRIFDYIKGVKKPTTVIYGGAVELADNLVGDDGTVAIRLVNDAFCKALPEAFGKPIVSTSANINSYPAPTCFADVDMAIKKVLTTSFNTVSRITAPPCLHLLSSGTKMALSPSSVPESIKG
jgi:L-threonylcarbamoyladenylate synthase